MTDIDLTKELCQAASSGDFQKVIDIFTNEESVGDSEMDTYPAIYAACCYGHLNIAKWLFKQDPSVDLNIRSGRILHAVLSIRTDTKPLDLSKVCDWLISVGAKQTPSCRTRWCEKVEKWHQEIHKKTHPSGSNLK